MLILTAENITGDRKLARPDGTSRYKIWVGINHVCLYTGEVDGHKRDTGASSLLRRIADHMEAADEIAKSMPMITRFLQDANAGVPEKAQKSLRKRERRAKPNRISDLMRAVEKGYVEAEESRAGRSLLVRVEPDGTKGRKVPAAHRRSKDEQRPR